MEPTELRARRWVPALAPVGASLFLLLVYCGIDLRGGRTGAGPGAEELAPRPAALTVTADELRAAYDADEAADGKYGGRRLRVVGTVGDTDADEFGNPCAVLVGKAGPAAGSVQCTFDKAMAVRLAALTRPHPLTVYGTCRGLVTSKVWLADCTY